MTNSTYRRLRRTVSTVKQSTASTPVACARRNCRQVRADRLGAGSTLARCGMAQAMLAPSLWPRRHSSPWIHGASPGSGCPWPAAAPDRGSPAPRLDDHAGVGSSGAPDQVGVPSQQRGRLDEQAAPDRAG
jgi:hypothetical protein